MLCVNRGQKTLYLNEKDILSRSGYFFVHPDDAQLMLLCHQQGKRLLQITAIDKAFTLTFFYLLTFLWQISGGFCFACNYVTSYSNARTFSQKKFPSFWYVLATSLRNKLLKRKFKNANKELYHGVDLWCTLLQHHESLVHVVTW